MNYEILRRLSRSTLDTDRVLFETVVVENYKDCKDAPKDRNPNQSMFTGSS